MIQIITFIANMIVSALVLALFVLAGLIILGIFYVLYVCFHALWEKVRRI